LVFGAAASHSGAVRFNLAENWDVADRIFGPGDDGQRRRDEHDVVQLAAAYLTPPPTDDDRPGYCGPAIYFDCGVSDFLFDTNRSLANALRAAQVPYEYHEYPGAHEWIYWDRHATDSLRFLARKLGITGA
jgi:S-formylglutathione hydrolase FrmB